MRTLEFRWTISRGQDTYGYNICSLWVDGQKVTSCNGGGYDMQGKCFGDWIASAFEKELNQLSIPMNQRNGQDIQEYYGLTFHDPNFDPGKAKIDGQTIDQREKKNKSFGLERYQSFYKASSKVPTKRHTIPLIDGACGFSSVQKIAEALGLTIQYVPTKGDNSIYTVTDTNM